MFPFLPEGRISVGVPARVGHAAGKSRYQRFREDSASEEAHLSGSGETQLFTHSSSHKSTINIVILHPATDRAGSLSRSEHAIRIPSFLSEHPSHNLIHGRLCFVLTNCPSEQMTASSGYQKKLFDM